jgi:hypothetical protein
MLAAFALQPESAMLRRMFEEALERAPENSMKWRTRALAQAARELGLFPSRRGASRDVLSVFEQALGAPIHLRNATGSGHPGQGGSSRRATNSDAERY